MSIIVIQCANRKHGNRLRYNGAEVHFVANPVQCEGQANFRPDDTIPNENRTWREFLVGYNNAGYNLDNLSRAIDLYCHPIYGEIKRQLGIENVYILSAGWGLVRGDFLLPNYDITFSGTSSWCNRRTPDMEFDDFNHLAEHPANAANTIYFFGGVSYREMFYPLAENIGGDKIIYYASTQIENREGFEFVPYNRSFTNWHYACARDFIEGRI